MNNAKLTGEQDPVLLNARPSTFPMMNDAQNMAFTSQPITAGSGKGILVATGDITVNAIVAFLLCSNREY